MKQRNDSLEWVVVILVAAAIAIGGIKWEQNHRPKKIRQDAPVSIVEQLPTPPAPVPTKPSTPKITTPVPAFLQYPALVSQLQQWNKESPGLSDMGVYGKSRGGKDLMYFRVTNKFNAMPKSVVLITACIHGNEPHSTTTVMAYIGTMLSTYGTDSEVTTLIDTRDIYFIPVVCPDSFPHSRHTDEVDPNRDFPGPSAPDHKSTPCVDQIQTFFKKIRPKAVISTHTFGRIMLTPFGDSKTPCPDHADFQRVVGKMAQMCRYKIDRACNMYPNVIRGSEIDWYYRNGAFPIVMEVGTHQRKPTPEEVQSEFLRVYKGVLYFMQDAPLVRVHPVSTWEDEWLTGQIMKIPIECRLGMAK